MILVDYLVSTYRVLAKYPALPYTPVVRLRVWLGPNLGAHKRCDPRKVRKCLYINNEQDEKEVLNFWLQSDLALELTM